MKFNIDKLVKYNKIGLKSKFIKFMFINNIVTWEMQEKHEVGGIIKMIINPIYGNSDIYQVFFYNVERNLIGYKPSREYVWFKIDFSQMSNPSRFAEDARFAWSFWNFRYTRCSKIPTRITEMKFSIT